MARPYSTELQIVFNDKLRPDARGEIMGKLHGDYELDSAIPQHRSGYDLKEGEKVIVSSMLSPNDPCLTEIIHSMMQIDGVSKVTSVSNLRHGGGTGV